FVAYVGYNKTYINLYGSFSVLFFFLLWIYVSWVLFLHGVKLCVLLDRSKGQQNIPEDEEN
ncbi:MAG: YihY/virulence factor BrkB family protein, partial [Neisseriaceae bacterium]|nr:YihY/virulence factor BrkB family protein [Neisseriaceae bacterium]